jgi:hypothetical protein
MATLRRAILAMITTAATSAGDPVERGPGDGAAPPTTASDSYPSNTVLYLDPDLVEGVEYARTTASSTSRRPAAFWDFVAACRTALGRVEADQTIL